MSTNGTTQDQFIKERLYFKGVSPKTDIWYNTAFKAFNRALNSKAFILQRIEEVRKRGVSTIRKPVSKSRQVKAWARVAFALPAVSCLAFLGRDILNVEAASRCTF